MHCPVEHYLLKRHRTGSLSLSEDISPKNKLLDKDSKSPQSPSPMLITDDESKDMRKASSVRSDMLKIERKCLIDKIITQFGNFKLENYANFDGHLAVHQNDKGTQG